MNRANSFVAGIKPVLLRTQYRCHPVLSKTPNQLFYEVFMRCCSRSSTRLIDLQNALNDGVTAEHRPPLLIPPSQPGRSLPPLAFCDVKGAAICDYVTRQVCLWQERSRSAMLASELNHLPTPRFMRV